jgi:hypothetical protein
MTTCLIFIALTAADWPLASRLDSDGPIRPPLYDKGFVLVVASRLSPGAPHARRFGPTGQSLPIRIDLADASGINVYSGAVLDRGGRAAFTALAVSNDGRPAALLIVTGANGTIERIIRTNPYLMMQVAVAGDGSIWGLGYNCEIGAGLSTAEVIHRYREDGTVLGRYVSRREIEARGGPRSHPALSVTYGTAAIVASNDRVGAFLPEASLWIEFSLDGALLNKATVAAPSPAVENSEEFFQGVYMTSDHRVLAVSRSGPKTRLLDLDRDSQAWRLHTTPPRGVFLACGSEGSALVACPFNAGERVRSIPVP